MKRLCPVFLSESFHQWVTCCSRQSVAAVSQCGFVKDQLHLGQLEPPPRPQPPMAFGLPSRGGEGVSTPACKMSPSIQWKAEVGLIGWSEGSNPPPCISHTGCYIAGTGLNRCTSGKPLLFQRPPLQLLVLPAFVLGLWCWGSRGRMAVVVVLIR